MMSLLIYYSSFFISIIFSAIYQKRVQNKDYPKVIKVLWAFLIMFPVIIIQGFRFNVGTDYYAYSVLYKEIVKGPNNYYFLSYLKEPLYLLENYIAFWLFGSSKALYFINAIIEGCFLFLFFDYYKNKINMSMAYTCCYFIVYPHFFNAERQGVAVVIVWFAIRYIAEKKFIKYLILILLASCFHNTALICLPLYFLNSLKKILRNRKWWIPIIIIVVFFIWQGRNIFLFISNYIGFLNNYGGFLLTSADEISFAFVLPFLFVLPCFLFYRNLLKNEKYNNIYLYLYFTDIILLCLSAIFAFGNRMLMYTDISIILLIAFTCKSFFSKKNKITFTLLFSILATTYFYIVYFYVGCDQIFPYNTILNI